MTDSQSPKDQSLFVILTKLFFNLALIVLPFVIPVYLPPTLVILYWLLTHIAEWIENRISGEVNHTLAWMLGGCFGMSGLMIENMPGTILGTLAGVTSFIALLVLHTGWKKLAKLEIRLGPAGPRVTKIDPVPFRGASAWSRPAPSTPKGDAVRVLSITEFVMGGPAICDYLLPDGSVIIGGGASTGFSPNGRYFVTPAPSRHDWPLMIYDQRRRRLHTCNVGSKFWEIDIVSDMTICGRQSPIDSNQSWVAMIDDLISHSATQDMADVRDIKLPKKYWDDIRKYHEKGFPRLPSTGSLSVDWTLRLPDSLMALQNPLYPLLDPQGQITVAGEDSGLVISMKNPVVIWRSDGLSFVCEAMPQNGGEKGWWLWDAQEKWKQLHLRQNLHRNIPHAFGSEPVDLYARHLIIGWELMQPSLSKGNVGELDSYTGSALEIDGKMFEMPVIRQIIPLQSGKSEDERVESAPLRNGHKLVWRFLRIDDDISRHVYQCEFQGHPLEGEWLLDHRLSSDGRYVALVAYAPPPAVPHRIAIFDSETGKLAWVRESFFSPELQGFDDNRLYLVHVNERRLDALPDGLGPEVYKTLGKPNEATVDLQITLPPTDHSRTFMRPDNRTRLHYRRTSIVLKNNTWVVT